MSQENEISISQPAAAPIDTKRPEFDPLARMANATELHASIRSVELADCVAAWNKRHGEALVRLGGQYEDGWMDRAALDTHTRAAQPAPSPADERAACTHQWTWADGKCADCGAATQQPTPTTGMTLAERISHVGGRVTEDGCIEFGSAMALDALIQHVIRDARAAAANETGAEGVDLADFTALIDDYQCAQKDGTHDERAKARIALLNAYRAAIGRSPAMAAEAVAIPAGWKAMPPSATTAMRMAMAKAAAEYMQRTGGNSPDAIYEAGFAAAPQPAQADARIDVEALLRACVPGGDICDPQRIADSIREWFDDHGAQADARDYAMGHRDGWNECLEAQASQADARVGLTGEQREAIEHAASCLDLSELSAERELAHELRVIASRVAQPHPKCHGCPINPTCPSTTCGVSQPEPRAEVTSVQWWLAELDQYGNPKLSDGAHSERAGADKAMYLIKNLGLDNKGKRWAVARVELSEPQPSADGVNHDAVSACRTMVDATRAGGA